MEHPVLHPGKYQIVGVNLQSFLLQEQTGMLRLLQITCGAYLSWGTTLGNAPYPHLICVHEVLLKVLPQKYVTTATGLEALQVSQQRPLLSYTAKIHFLASLT